MYVQKAVPNSMRAATRNSRALQHSIRHRVPSIPGRARNASTASLTAEADVPVPPQPLAPEIDSSASRRDAIKNAKPFSAFLTDNFNRQHDYLRISITERCNLRCLYCMPEEGVQLSPPAHLLTTPEIFYLSSLFVSQGVTKIRLTGGEPTVRKDVVPLMQQIGSLRSKGLKELALTTNGISLHRKLDAMVEAGLTGVNLSLDTLDPFQFQIMTRRMGFDAVMRSIDRILEMKRLGANIKLKVNCVVMRGMNDREIVPFVELGREKDIEVRFIEYMPFGGNKWSKGKMLPYQEMLEMIRLKYPEIHRVQGHKNDTSKTYQVPGFVGRVGFITSMTDDFCGTCNRLRITGDGNLKVCLHGNAEVSLRDILREGNEGKPINQAAFEALKELETTRQDAMLSDATPLGWGPREHQLLGIIGKAVKRKKEKHAGMGELENMENRPMILIDKSNQTLLPSDARLDSLRWNVPHRASNYSSSHPQWRLPSQHLLARGSHVPLMQHIRNFSTNTLFNSPEAQREDLEPSPADHSLSMLTEGTGREVTAQETRSEEQPRTDHTRKNALEAHLRRAGLKPNRRSGRRVNRAAKAKNVIIAAEWWRNAQAAQKERMDVLAAREAEKEERKSPFKAGQAALAHEAKFPSVREDWAQSESTTYDPTFIGSSDERFPDDEDLSPSVMEEWGHTKSTTYDPTRIELDDERSQDKDDTPSLGASHFDAQQEATATSTGRMTSADIARAAFAKVMSKPAPTGTPYIPPSPATGRSSDILEEPIKRETFTVEDVRAQSIQDGPIPRLLYKQEQARLELELHNEERRKQPDKPTEMPKIGKDVQKSMGTLQPSTDEFYEAFLYPFAEFRPIFDEKIAHKRRGTADPRLLERVFDPAFNILNRSLFHRLRQEIWSVAVGLREHESRVMGQVSIDKSRLRRAMEDQVRRRDSGRPRLRDDPLWGELILNSMLTREAAAANFQMSEEELEVWWDTRHKFRTRMFRNVKFSKTAASIGRLLDDAKNYAKVRELERQQAPAKAELFLKEWTTMSYEICRELWFIIMGVQSLELRTMPWWDFRITMDDVQAAMTHLARARSIGLPRPRISDRDELFRIRGKLREQKAGNQMEMLEMKRQALRRADIRLLGNWADDPSLPVPSDEDLMTYSRLDAPVTKPYIPEDEYRTARRLIIVERDVDKLNNQIAAWRRELYTILTNVSFEGAKTHQYISSVFLKAAVESYQTGQRAKTSGKTALQRLKSSVHHIRTMVKQRARKEEAAAIRNAELEELAGMNKKMEEAERKTKAAQSGPRHVAGEVSAAPSNAEANGRVSMEDKSDSLPNEDALAQTSLGVFELPHEVESGYLMSGPAEGVEAEQSPSADPSVASLDESISGASSSDITELAQDVDISHQMLESASEDTVKQPTLADSSDSLSEGRKPRASSSGAPKLTRRLKASREVSKPPSKRTSKKATLADTPDPSPKAVRSRSSSSSAPKLPRKAKTGDKVPKTAPQATANRKALADTPDSSPEVDESPSSSFGMSELPHEVEFSYQPKSRFTGSRKLLSPLRRMPDIDKLPVEHEDRTTEEKKLTHLTSTGEARMVSVAAKPATKRTAIATGLVLFSASETYSLVTNAALKKGDVLSISRIAGIQAAKMCPSIIPLCHPIMLSSVGVDVLPFQDQRGSGIAIEAKVKCTGPTGVEMEALTAVMGAALTVVDMVKAVDRAARIEDVKVVYKSGGKSGDWIDEDWQSLKGDV